MRYKGDFIGLLLKEERVVIDYIIRAYSKYASLSEPQIYNLDKSLRIIADNQEFTKVTFDKLLDLFYYTLHFDPIAFHTHPKNGYFWGGWYEIPSSNRDLAAKKLSNRIKKRRRFIDDSWYREFNESFDWETLVDKDESKKAAKEGIKNALGSRSGEISDGRDPRSAVVVPFSKKRD